MFGHEQHELLEAMLAELRALHATSTAAQARANAGRAVNGVLEASTVQLDSSGLWTRSYGVAIGSIVVSNPNSTAVTVYAGPPTTSSVPTVGVGVFSVPANSVLTIPIDHHAVTLYGTAGNLIGIQVFSGLQPYGLST